MSALRAAGLVALLACVACAGGAPADPPLPELAATDTPWFERVDARAGLDFTYRSGHAERFLFPEIIGGGAALFDMDGDGDLDAYLVQGGSVEAGGGPPGNQLFENGGDGTFRDVSAGSGADDAGYGMGVAAGDYDGDGDVDLYVTNYGPNALLRNDGGGNFTSVGRAAGVDDAGWGTSAAFLDYDLDGDLDLFVVNYVNWAPRIEQDCYSPAGLRDYCLPTNYNAPAADRLFRNEGNGRFTDVSESAGLLAAFGNGLGVVVADFDDDGRPDVFVANDTTMNQLWMNQGDGRFLDEALLRGCALDEHGMTKAGMGVAAADVDDDGDFDLLVVNLQGQTDSYFRNDRGYFSDQTGRVGLGTSSRWNTRFGIGLHDLNNDGWLDLYQANGRVVRSAEPGAADPYAEPDLLLRGGPDGRFVEQQPRGGTAERLIATGRAAAFGDVDGDGGIDVLVVNRDAPAFLLHNQVPDRGHWIAFRVVDARGRDALGARVTVGLDGRRVVREVRSTYGYCAASDPRIHVGLGAATGVTDVTVLWPGGAEERFGDVSADRVVTLRHGEGH